MSIITNYNIIQNEIQSTALHASRNPSDITIIAVSKTFPSVLMQEAIDCGIRLFGENKIQEAKKKSNELNGNFSFHMIGHLQSNKANDAVKLFDLIHSIDKENTAIILNNKALKINKIQKILVQINASGETTKSGIQPTQAIPFFEKIIGLSNINILGLMTMAPYTNDLTIIRNTFKKTRENLAAINSHFGIDLKELSMGMSSDYHIAIEEGSTMVRIGSAIFGERNYSQ